MEFETINDLYVRVIPALRTKLSELHRVGFIHMREEDIWNALRDKKWKKTINLSLAEMVHDILNLEHSVIDDYLKEQMMNMEKTPNVD